MDERTRPALPDAARQAAAEFAKALADTSQFHCWEKALLSINQDKAAVDTAQKIQELQSRAKSAIESGNLLNLTGVSYRKELEKMTGEYRLRPAVASYLEAEGEFRAFCQALNVLISDAAEIDFAKLGASGCCS